MENNKYVDFVSDEDFLECVKKVTDSYNKDLIEKSLIESLTKSDNTTDAFKLIFDVYSTSTDLSDWVKLESTRQSDKTVTNKIGEFHQELLGKVEGWEDLGKGDKTEVDLKKEDNTIFIELKNKHNTMNRDSSKQVREKLKNILKKYPNATTYWAYIISKKYKSVNQTWKFKNEDNPQIKQVSWKKVYELITGDPNALEKTYKALPCAINDIVGDFKLSDDENKILEDYTRFIFKD